MIVNENVVAKAIYDTISSKPIVMDSWGFRCPVATEDGIEFIVNGFLHKGKVRVCHASDGTFTVELIGEGGVVISRSEGICADDLVETIDNAVEYPGTMEQYLDMVCNEYGMKRTQQ